MPIEPVGLNLSGFNNISLPVFDFKNNSIDFLNDLPVKANQVSGGYWGIISLSVLFTFLMWKFRQDQADGGDYGFNTMRSLGLGSCICSIIGLYALNMGYFVNFYHVAIFIVIAFISVGVVWKTQN